MLGPPSANNLMATTPINGRWRIFFLFQKVKGKVVYGQEPPSGESTTTESGVNYQLLAVMH